MWMYNFKLSRAYGWKNRQYHKSDPSPVPSQSQALTLVPRYRESPGKYGTPKISRPDERTYPHPKTIHNKQENVHTQLENVSEE